VKKTSIYLDEELDARLAEAAARERITKAEFIRKALEAAVGQRPRLVGRGSFSKGDEREWQPS
jgi:predicted transcriptional regulator